MNELTKIATNELRNATPRIDLQKKYAYEKRLTKNYTKRDKKKVLIRLTSRNAKHEIKDNKKFAISRGYNKIIIIIMSTGLYYVLSKNTC